MTYDREAYIAAWGSASLPWIVGGPNDEFKLPKLPPGYDWLLTREVTGELPNCHPTYRLSLGREEDNAVKVLGYGRIDKKMYGESGVRELAQRLKEKHARQPSTGTADVGQHCGSGPREASGAASSSEPAQS